MGTINKTNTLYHHFREKGASAIRLKQTFPFKTFYLQNIRAAIDARNLTLLYVVLLCFPALFLRLDRYICWPIPIPIYWYQQTEYRYRLIWILVKSGSNPNCFKVFLRFALGYIIIFKVVFYSKCSTPTG